MKHYIFIIVALIAAICPAATTIFQDCEDTTGWMIDTTGSTCKLNFAESSVVGGYYLDATIYSTTANNGIVGFYVPLGDANVPAGKTPAELTALNVYGQMDIKIHGGYGTTIYVAQIGMFSGDTDNDPNYVRAGAKLGSNRIFPNIDNGLTARDANSSFRVDGLTCRVKMHVYYNSGQVLMDMDVYSFNDATYAIELKGSKSVVLLDTGESLATPLSYFGISNMANSTYKWIRASVDNLYVSNVSEYSGSDIPSWLIGPSPTTIFQNFESMTGWTTRIDTSAPGDVMLSRVQDPNTNGYFLDTKIYRNNVDNTTTSVYTSLGDAAIGINTPAGRVKECWIQYDVRGRAGTSGILRASTGIFNAAGDNDGIPQTTFLGTRNSGTPRTDGGSRANGTNSNSPVATPSMLGAQVVRVKAHIYNNADANQTLMDFTVVGYDANGTQIDDPCTITGWIALTPEKTIDVGADSFGIRNWIGSNSSCELDYDNLYFSNIGDYETTHSGRETPWPSWVKMPPTFEIVAQPESRELFFFGDAYPTSSTDDPNIVRLTYTNIGSGYYYGDLVLAFRLPQLPSGKVISKATLNLYYWRYLINYPPQIDLYAITPYRNGSADPGITGCYGEEDCADYYIGLADTTDAVLIQKNIAPVSVLDPMVTGYINKWVSSDETGHALASFMQNQYLAGAGANDWILLRFNSAVTELSGHTVRHEIYGPSHIDVNSRPYIEYEIVDANQGYWQAVTLEPSKTIMESGVFSEPNNNLGCFKVGDVNLNAELIVPFKFPQLQSGEYIKETAFTGGWGGRSPAGSFDTDLYGLPHRSSTAFQSSDFWTGPYSPQPGDVPDINCGTPLESDVFDGFPTNSGQTWSLDAEGQIRMACYMNALKTAGATSSDYGFLRFGMRYDDFYYYVRQTISDLVFWARIATEAPTNCLGTPDTEGACPIYNSPDRLLADEDGDCKVTFTDLKIMAANWLDCDASPSIIFCP